MIFPFWGAAPRQRRAKKVGSIRSPDLIQLAISYIHQSTYQSQFDNGTYQLP